MTCLVCGQEFDRDDFCTRCGYPVTLFTDASPEAAQQERERAAAYLKKILSDTELSLVSYIYKPQGNKIVLSDKKKHNLGSVQQLFDSDLWLEPQITNLYEGKLSVQAECTFNGETKPISITLKANSQAPRLALGIRITRDLLLCFTLKDNEKVLDEQKVPFLTI